MTGLAWPLVGGIVLGLAEPFVLALTEPFELVAALAPVGPLSTKAWSRVGIGAGSGADGAGVGAGRSRHGSKSVPQVWHHRKFAVLCAPLVGQAEAEAGASIASRRSRTIAQIRYSRSAMDVTPAATIRPPSRSTTS
jgi:hypothetical protein